MAYFCHHVYSWTWTQIKNALHLFAPVIPVTHPWDLVTVILSLIVVQLLSQWLILLALVSLSKFVIFESFMKAILERWLSRNRLKDSSVMFQNVANTFTCFSAFGTYRKSVLDLNSSEKLAISASKNTNPLARIARAVREIGFLAHDQDVKSEVEAEYFQTIKWKL